MGDKRNKTAEETKAEYVEKMGSTLGPVYYALWCEVVSVNWTWNEFLELYASKPSRVELLNKSAPFFFRTVHNVFWDNTLLHIARLTDRIIVCGKENLTIQKLPKMVSRDLQGSVEALVEVALEKSEFCRDWRNRRIAHRDLQLAIKDAPMLPLKTATRKKVDEALCAIGDVLNSISRPYMGSTTVFDRGVYSSGAGQLIYVLDDGLRMEQERIARIKSHGWDPVLDGRRDL